MSATLVAGQRRYTPRVWTSTFDPTNASKASTGYLVGDVWLNTATLNEFTLVDQSNGVWRHKPRVWQSGVAVTLGAVTSEVVVATISLAANALGADGRLDVDYTWDMSSSGNNKTMRTYFGAAGAGAGGTVLSGIALTTQLALHEKRFIQNAHATNVQTGVGGTTGGFGNAASLACASAAIDTTAASEFVITGQKASSGDTLTLRHYCAVLTRPDIS